MRIIFTFLVIVGAIFIILPQASLGEVQRKINYQSELTKTDFLDLVVDNCYEFKVSVFLNDEEGGFSDRHDYYVGGCPLDLATGDFNEDNHLDLALTDRYNAGVSVLLGDSQGGFGTPLVFPVHGYVGGIASGDFDGDDLLDVAVTTCSDSGCTVSVLLGDGIGGLVHAGDYPVGLTLYASILPVIIAAKLNEDNLLDLAVINSEDHDISVLLNDGAGGFDDRQDYAVWTQSSLDSPSDIAAADFNGDDRLDLAVAINCYGMVSVFFNNGTGGFDNRQDESVGWWNISISAGDFNEDDSIDLAVVDLYYDEVNILLGNGKGDFGDPVAYPVGEDPEGLAVGDLDGDNVLDLAVTNRTDDDMSILFGYGDGSFGNRQDYPVGEYPRSIVVGYFSSGVARGDANGDGIVDVGDVVYLVSYLYRNGPAPDPLWTGDANCDDIINVGDIVYLVSYLYRGGPPPGCKSLWDVSAGG